MKSIGEGNIREHIAVIVIVFLTFFLVYMLAEVGTIPFRASPQEERLLQISHIVCPNCSMLCCCSSYIYKCAEEYDFKHNTSGLYTGFVVNGSLLR